MHCNCVCTLSGPKNTQWHIAYWMLWHAMEVFWLTKWAFTGGKLLHFLKLVPLSFLHVVWYLGCITTMHCEKVILIIPTQNIYASCELPQHDWNIREEWSLSIWGVIHSQLKTVAKKTKNSGWSLFAAAFDSLKNQMWFFFQITNGKKLLWFLEKLVWLIFHINNSFTFKVSWRTTTVF